MKSALFLNIIIGESTAVLKLLSGKDQALLVRRDAFLVLNLGFHVVNGVRRFNFEGDGLARQCLHKNLHTTTETEDCTNAIYRYE